MSKQDVVERLLKASTNGQWSVSSAFGNAGSMTGRPQILQADVNKAIAAWLQNNDATGVWQLAETLRITGALTDSEYEQIMEAIDGEK